MRRSLYRRNRIDKPPANARVQSRRAQGSAHRSRAARGRGARRGGAARADPGGPAGRLAEDVHRRARRAAARRGRGPAPAPVHGAELALEPARRRLPDRRPPGPGPARARHAPGRDVPELRVRVGHVRLARADRDGVRRPRRPEAVPDGRRPRSRRWRRSRCRRGCPGGGNVFTDFGGGGYFYLDEQRPGRDPDDVAATSSSSARTRTARPSSSTRDYDLSTAVLPGDKIISALPDWLGPALVRLPDGRRRDRRPRHAARCAALPLRERIENSFAVDDDGGVYVVTDKAMYRLRRGGERLPGDDVARGLRELRDRQAGPGRAPARARRRR